MYHYDNNIVNDHIDRYEGKWEKLCFITQPIITNDFSSNFVVRFNFLIVVVHTRFY